MRFDARFPGGSVHNHRQSDAIQEAVERRSGFLLHSDPRPPRPIKGMEKLSPVARGRSTGAKQSGTAQGR